MKIKELTDGWRGEFRALVASITTKLKKNGDEYYDVVLMDSSETITMKVWEPCTFKILVNQVVEVKGATVQEYNGVLQMAGKSFSVCEDAKPEDFLQRSEFTTESMWKALDTVLNKVEDKYCKELIQAVRTDTDFVERFSKHGAGKKVHGAYIGGLLEHTLRVVQIAYKIALVYGNLNTDLIITSAFFHDIGKLREFSELPASEYGDEGNYLGHLAIGVLEIEKLTAKIPDFPEDVKLKIMHCIASHHGKLEFGAIKLPAIPEAFVVSEADMIDSRLNIFGENTIQGKWSEKNFLLGTAIHSGGFEYEQ